MTCSLFAVSEKHRSPAEVSNVAATQAAIEATPRARLIHAVSLLLEGQWRAFVFQELPAFAELAFMGAAFIIIMVVDGVAANAPH